MPVIPAQCPNCGGFLNIDNSLEAAKCSHCGCPFLVEEAVNNYNITNNISAGVVNVVGENSYEDRLKAADTFLDLKRFDEARDSYWEAVHLVPQDYRGWVGVVLAESGNLKWRIRSEEKLRNFDEYYKNAISFLKGNTPEVLERIREYINSQKEMNEDEKKDLIAKKNDYDKRYKEYERKLDSIRSRKESIGRSSSQLESELRQLENESYFSGLNTSIGLIIGPILVVIGLIICLWSKGLGIVLAVIGFIVLLFNISTRSNNKQKICDKQDKIKEYGALYREAEDEYNQLIQERDKSLQPVNFDSEYRRFR